MPHRSDDSLAEDDSEETQDLRVKPIATFGVLTDVQYADVEDGTSYDGKRMRYYRNSLNLVKESITNWRQYQIENDTKIKFIIQLGDLVDGKAKAINDSLPSVRKVIGEMNKLFDGNEMDDEGKPRLLHIFGNHEMYNFLRRDLMNIELNSAKLLNQNTPHAANANFYTYQVTDKLLLICLDYYEYSVLGYEESNETYQNALAFLTKHNKNQDLNSVEGLRGHAQRFSKFNGGLSDFQMEWLRQQLINCKERSMKAIVCGHIPIHAQASDPMCLAWNSKQVLELLWSFDHTVIAYFAGHDHQGGYFRDKYNIHHVTFAAILETPSNSNAYATIKVYSNKISVEGVGVIGYYECYFD